VQQLLVQFYSVNPRFNTLYTVGAHGAQQAHAQRRLHLRAAGGVRRPGRGLPVRPSRLPLGSNEIILTAELRLASSSMASSA
jgi:hypothetical protein